MSVSPQGKREEKVDWRPALTAMCLTSEQAAAIVVARAQVTVKIEECAIHPCIHVPCCFQSHVLPRLAQCRQPGGFA